MKTLLKLILSIALIASSVLFEYLIHPISDILIIFTVIFGTILMGIYSGKLIVEMVDKSEK